MNPMNQPDSLMQERGVTNVSFHAVLKGLREADIYVTLVSTLTLGKACSRIVGIQFGVGMEDPNSPNKTKVGSL
jgi:hypothetical protein